MNKGVTTVFLIRHGEIDNSQRILYGCNIDMKLNDIGREQIRVIAEKIRKSGYKIEKIYTSPLSRAKSSLSILADAFQFHLGGGVASHLGILTLFRTRDVLFFRVLFDKMRYPKQNPYRHLDF